MDRSRRRLLQAAAAAPLALPFAALAQPAAGALLRAPRHALVIGNGRYQEHALKNPVNDARALAVQLERSGFAVSTGLDLDRAQMAAAVRAYAEGLARARAVGLFYFAGHGMQLSWRNYLLPVDAVVRSIDEVQQRCVDLNTLIEAIARAANPMNLVVLDACRDNPFGRDFRVEQKGLSQLDAPPGTLLAYATSPGNVASDGEGANGLYTENLLREMQVPEAKIEDVFKRVRLAVRRRSNGQQVPWESTSLEEDFWFIPPKELKRLSDEEAEREFRQELELWERAQAGRESTLLEDYLKRYPSGRFSELAHAQLDRVLAQQGEKKVEVVSAPENPYSKGSATANTRYQVGDSYTFRQSDLYTREVAREYTLIITALTGTEVIYNQGRVITDLLGNPLLSGDGRRYSPNQNYPAEFAVGRRWVSRFSMTTPKGGTLDNAIEFRISGRERIRVPAGEFDTFVVEQRGRAAAPHMRFPMQMSGKAWFAPEKSRQPIARELLRQAPNGKLISSERHELVAFRQA